MNEQAKHTPWKVRTVSGYAGGLKRQAQVTLVIDTESDTVEQVRESVEALPALLKQRDELRDMLSFLVTVIGNQDLTITRPDSRASLENFLSQARAAIAQCEKGEK